MLAAVPCPCCGADLDVQVTTLPTLSMVGGTRAVMRLHLERIACSACGCDFTEE
jgi:hypothetical protein